MEISEIEYNTIEFGFVIDALKYILDRFEERLYEEYCVMLKNEEEREHYYELCSNLFFLTKIAGSLKKIKDKFDKDIEAHYASL